MRATITSLFITSAVFLHSVELSSQASSSGAGDVPPHYITQAPKYLGNIEGISIPIGDEIKTRTRILGIDTGRKVEPITVYGEFIIFERKRQLDPQNPEVLYDAVKVSEEDWKLFIADISKNNPKLFWMADSAQQTVEALNLARVAAERLLRAPKLSRLRNMFSSISNSQQDQPNSPRGGLSISTRRSESVENSMSRLSIGSPRVSTTPKMSATMELRKSILSDRRSKKKPDRKE